jgi:Helix-turn-helix
VDVLQTAGGEVTGGVVGTTGPIRASPPDGVSSRLEPAPAAAAGPSTVTEPNSPVAAVPGSAGGMTHRSSASFAAWLADALRREGMTMEAAARRLKVSVKTVSRWVRGTTEPRLCDLSRIRDVFGDLPFP